MKYQYINIFLAQLAIKHKIFLNYKTMLIKPAQKSFQLSYLTTLQSLQSDSSNAFNSNINMEPHLSIIKNIFLFSLPYNSELLLLLSKLKELGFLTYSIQFRTVLIFINLFSFSQIVVHSKPSRQIFKKAGNKTILTDHLSLPIGQTYPSLLTKDSGFGFSILRTSQGFLTSTEAKELKIGGELLFSIL